MTNNPCQSHDHMTNNPCQSHDLTCAMQGKRGGHPARTVVQHPRLPHQAYMHSGAASDEGMGGEGMKGEGTRDEGMTGERMTGEGTCI